MKVIESLQKMDLTSLSTLSAETFDLVSCLCNLLCWKHPLHHQWNASCLNQAEPCLQLVPCLKTSRCFIILSEKQPTGISSYAGQFTLCCGSKRYKAQFSHVALHIFENPHLPEVNPFIDYTRASLSEDRLLWTLSRIKDRFRTNHVKITTVAEKWFQRDGKLVMTKVVGGILAKEGIHESEYDLANSPVYRRHIPMISNWMRCTNSGYHYPTRGVCDRRITRRIPCIPIWLQNTMPAWAFWRRKNTLFCMTYNSTIVNPARKPRGDDRPQ